MEQDPTHGSQQLTDTRDMVVVHTALLRELRLAPGVVRRSDPGDKRQTRLIAGHLMFVNDLLEHHHAGEDRLLWPLLRERLPNELNPVLELMAVQHGKVHEAAAAASAAVAEWRNRPASASRDALAERLAELHVVLEEHLDAEERQVLPLAAAHLSPAEWKAIGAAGAAGIPKPKLFTVFGMFGYEGEPEVVASMLQEAPAPVRPVVRLLAPRAYARYARAVHGTPMP